MDKCRYKSFRFILALFASMIIMVGLSINVSASEQATQNAVVERIREAIRNGYTSVILYNPQDSNTNLQVNKDEASALIDKAIDAELYYTDIRGGVTNRRISYTRVSQTVVAIYLTYGVDNSTFDIRKKNMDNVIASAKSRIKPGMTDLEKTVIVHDFIVTHCTYDYDNYKNNCVPDSSYTAYRVLVEGKGVCQGYSKAFAIILRQLGISTIRISSESMSHEWNMVNIDGKWYHADLTWDDPVWNDGKIRSYYVTHKYFLRTDDEFKKLGHSGWTASYSATSKTYSNWYFNDVESALCYNNGYWYACKNGKLVKAKINGSSASVVSAYTTSLTTPSMAKVSYLTYLNDTSVKVTVTDYVKTSSTVYSPKTKTVTYVFGKIYNAPAKTVKVSATKISSAKVAKQKVTLQWKKVSGANGYVIYISKKSGSGFKAVKTIKSGNTLKFTTGKTSKGKYYYRIKTYKVVSGKKIYSSYSAAKAVTIR